MADIIQPHRVSAQSRRCIGWQYHCVVNTELGGTIPRALKLTQVASARVRIQADVCHSESNVGE
jgi:hypothetical protein